MSLKIKLKSFFDNIESIKNQITTKEATQNKLIIPFIKHLGYDVNNKLEVITSSSSDLVPEKVDYGIMNNGNLIIIIKVISCTIELLEHNSNINKSFNKYKPKVAIYTNGMDYMLYTDSGDKGYMDAQPFLVFNIFNLNNFQINELTKFEKESYDESSALEKVYFEKCLDAMYHELNDEIVSPSTEFVKLLTKRVEIELNDKRVEKVLLRQSNNLAYKAINQILFERETFLILKTILRTKIDFKRISCSSSYRYDELCYSTEPVDSVNFHIDDLSKLICRLWLVDEKIYLWIIGEEKVFIDSIDDIFNYQETILKAVEQFI